MSGIAVAWLALEITGEDAQGLVVGGAVAAYTLPGIAAGLILGKQLGRFSPAGLLVLDTGLRMLMLGMIAALAITDNLSVPSYIALLGASSLLHAWGLGARRGLVAQLLSRESWLSGNSVLMTQDHVALVIGPALAGVLTVAFGAGWVFAIDATSYGILGFFAWTVQSRSSSSDVETAPSDARTGLRQVLADRQLLRILTMTFLFYFLYGPVDVALPIYIAQDLRGTAGELGLLWTGFGLGSVLGGLIAGGLPHEGDEILLPGRTRISLQKAATAIIAAWGLAILPIGLTKGFGLAIVALTIGGVVYGPYGVFLATLLQRAAPTSQITAIGAAWHSVLLSAFPAGAAVGGLIVSAVGSQATILVSASATIALACTAFALSAKTELRFSPPTTERP